jgi:AcrR family transcriptional regulator
LRRREQNKREKLERIRSAALKLFSLQGYESTTMRQVAAEAGVALGTLSLYASDKRDLSLLAFNEHINSLLEKGVKAAWRDKDAPLEQRLVAFFKVFYTDFKKNIILARIFLQLNYQPTGMHGPYYKEMSGRMASALANMVDDARSRGEISCDESDDLIGRHFFFVFSGAVRWWIAEPKPKLREGIEELTSLFRIQIRGLK